MALLTLTWACDDDGKKSSPELDAAEGVDTADVDPTEVDPNDGDVASDLDLSDLPHDPDLGDLADTPDHVDQTDVGPDPDAADFEWPGDVGPIDVSPSPYWRHTVTFPDDPFLSAMQFWDVMLPRWIKFAVFIDDPTKVYYQDTAHYAFHYDFATAHLDPVQGISAADFAAITLRADQQRLILGAVIYAPGFPEYGVQLLRHEPYHPEMVAHVLALVADSVIAPQGTRHVYLPAASQRRAAANSAAFFADLGFPIREEAAWAGGDTSAHSGWALGTLRALPTEAIAAAVAAGELGPQDILLTDSLPAELPPVAALITRQPFSSRAAAVAQARSQGILLTHLVQPSWDPQALVGRFVSLRANGEASEGRGSLRLDDADTMPAADRATLLALALPAPRTVPTPSKAGQDLSAIALIPAISAAAYGPAALRAQRLQAAQPSLTLAGYALPFDLWLDTAAAGLGADLVSRMQTHGPDPDMTALVADLAALRAALGDALPAAERTRLHAALAPLGQTPMRLFASSSTGFDEGLRSYWVCPADDLSGATSGPSACDSSVSSPQPVEAALLRLWQQQLSPTPTLARLRAAIPPANWAFGALLYPLPTPGQGHGLISFDSSSTARIVARPGPWQAQDPVGISEHIDVAIFGFGDYVYFVQGSEETRRGELVLAWEEDYLAIVDAIRPFKQTLDAASGRLTLHWSINDGQVALWLPHQQPHPDNQPRLDPYLLAGEYRFCTFQGEAVDVWSNHRLKSEWTLRTRNVRLDAAGFATPFYTHIDLRLYGAQGLESISGDPSTWPAASHRAPDGVVDGWQMGSGDDLRHLELWSNRWQWLHSPVNGPILTLDEVQLTLQARYTTPVPVHDWNGWNTRSEDEVRLGLCPDDPAQVRGDLQTRTWQSLGGVHITTSFYWPPPPRGISAGYTAPLVDWVETTIEGLTTTPLVLRGYFSQTYRPHHHNFGEDFIFEPFQEAGLDPGLLAELDAKNIRLLYVVNAYMADADIIALDSDGKATPID